jgi:hypothetical protein
MLRDLDGIGLKHSSLNYCDQTKSCKAMNICAFVLLKVFWFVVFFVHIFIKIAFVLQKCYFFKSFFVHIFFMKIAFVLLNKYLDRKD